MTIGRRTLLAGAATAALAATWRTASAGTDAVRASSPGPGTAGAVWMPLLADIGAHEPSLPRIDWIGGNPGQVQIQLLTGALDVSVFGPLGLAQARAQGHDIVIFAPALNNHGRWIVRGDSAFRTPHDLIGKRIATQPETSETYKQAALAAAMHGIDLKRDTHLVFGPPIVNLALFTRGDVDAVIELEPLATRLVGQGARQIAKVGDMWKAAGGNETLFLVGLAARRDWLQANRGHANRIAQLYLDLNRRLLAAPDLFRRYHASLSIPDTDQAAIALLPQRMPEVYADRWDAAVWTDIDRQVARAAQLGLVPDVPAHTLYDTSFLGAA